MRQFKPCTSVTTYFSALSILPSVFSCSSLVLCFLLKFIPWIILTDPYFSVQQSLNWRWCLGLKAYDSFLRDLSSTKCCWLWCILALRGEWREICSLVDNVLRENWPVSAKWDQHTDGINHRRDLDHLNISGMTNSVCLCKEWWWAIHLRNTSYLKFWHSKLCCFWIVCKDDWIYIA